MTTFEDQPVGGLRIAEIHLATGDHSTPRQPAKAVVYLFVLQLEGSSPELTGQSCCEARLRRLLSVYDRPGPYRVTLSRTWPKNRRGNP